MHRVQKHSGIITKPYSQRPQSDYSPLYLSLSTITCAKQNLNSDALHSQSCAIMPSLTMEDINLARKIEERLPDRALTVIEKAGILVRRRDERLYLVGGAVRDLLLEKPVLDIDLVLEGDAILLANELAQGEDVKITSHKPFLTASLRWSDISLDLTTARRECYACPGALPAVEPANLKEDLLRRDFSINAMAVSLNQEDYGRLIDFYGGLDDLHHKLIRTLHEKSFSDDATRIWRAVRYEQRLDFRIEAGTQILLQRDLSIFKTVSGDRIW